MADKRVSVTIDGEETVSAATAKAETGLAGFANRIKSSITSFVDFKAAWDMAAGAIGKFGEYVGKAIEEAQNSREAMGQLAIAVNNSGASFTKMSPEIDATLNKLARMTKFGDDDFARAMQQMTLKTGDAKWALGNLGQAADLAAAGNVDLSVAADALAKAHEGNTKALFKMVPELKGATNWQELLAQKTAGAAEAQMQQLGPIDQAKKQFGEVLESIGKVILGNDQFTKGGFQVADMLANVASWIDTNAKQLGKFIDAIGEVASNLWQSLKPSLEVFGKIAGPLIKAFVGLISEASFAIRALSIYAQDTSGKVIESIAWLVEKGGVVLKAFGINVTDGIVQTMQTFGQKMRSEASTSWTQLEGDHQAFWERMKGTGNTAVATVQTQEVEKRRIVKEQLDGQDADYKDFLKKVEATYKLLNQLVVPYKEVLKTLGPAIKESLDVDHAARFNAAWKTADDNARALIDRMKANPLPPLIKPASDAVGNMATEISDSAGFVLDVGTNLGIINEDAKRVLETTKGIGGTLKDMATNGFSWVGAAGILGGVASIVSTMMQHDTERRRLLDENNRRLQAVAEGLSAADLTSSGENINKSITALEAFLDPAQYEALGVDPATYKAPVEFLLQALRGTGLSMAQLKAVARDAGIELFDSKGRLVNEAIPQLLTILRTITSQGAGTFTQKLQDFRDNQSLNGIAGFGSVRDLAAFLKGTGNVAALNGIDFGTSASAGAGLRQLFRDITDGKIDPAAFGKLSMAQLKSIIRDMLGIIGTPEEPPVTNSGPDGSGGSTSSDSAPGNTGSTGGIAPETVQTVVKAMDTNLAGILTEHTALHTRIADATEESARNLKEINTKMDELIDATASQRDRFDRELAQRRLVSAASAGIGPVF